jgi:hypothetical protein
VPHSLGERKKYTIPYYSTDRLALQQPKKNFLIFLKKPIDKRRPICYNTIRYEPRPTAAQAESKIFEKSFQKPIDKANAMCYNKQVVGQQPTAQTGA